MKIACSDALFYISYGCLISIFLLFALSFWSQTDYMASLAIFSVLALAAFLFFHGLGAAFEATLEREFRNKNN
jgi:hypothetical protein